MLNWKHALLIGIIIVLLTGVVCVGVIAVTLVDDAQDGYRQGEQDGDIIMEEMQISEKQTEDRRSDEEQTGEGRVAEGRIGEGQTGEEQSGGGQTGERQTGEDQTAKGQSEGKSTGKTPSGTEQTGKEQLIILQNPAMYTYDNMQKDLELLPLLYGDYVTVDSLGQTADDRQLYHIIIGNSASEHKIFINGSIHGREYMTTQLVMKQTVTFLQHVSAGDSYEGYSYKSLLENTAIHVVPMVNPDGVSISQFGLSGLLREASRQKVKEIASLDGSAAEGYYLTRWKANANGVDLNRNFDALWESYEGSGHPSSDHYKGASIGCETESAALIALTQQEMFDRTISYHTQGSVIYWYFGQTGALYDETLDFANCISDATGYPADANYEYLDPAGYKDWGICKLEIVGLTVEIGRETSPVPAAQFSDIWERNRYVWEETILNVKQ